MHRYLNAWIAFPLAERWTGRDIRRKVTALRAEMALPFAERRRRQLERLADIIEQAVCDVPYYRDLVRTCRFDPRRVARDQRYLEDLPYLTKDIVREHGGRLLSERFVRVRIQRG